MRTARVLLAAVAATTLVGGLAVAGSAATAVDPGPATFTNYAAPASLGNNAGEPTLGINPKTGAVLFQAGLEFLKVTIDDAAGKAVWTRQTHELPHVTSLDPILETDPDTGRTFSSQLLAACSQMEFTDDDGASFTPSEGCGLLAAVDHQTVGVGPYVKGGPLVKNPVTNYPNVVYYCAQDIVTAKCSVSTDGGLTFPTTGVAFATPDCGVGGLFGHLKSAPDGTVYLPPSRCGDASPLAAARPGAAVAVSEDNGVTWNVRKVPGSAMGDAGHPVAATGTNGDVYLGWGSREGSGPGGPVKVALSQDKGRTWTAPVALGQDLAAPVLNSRFPVGVAGDDGRAAIGYLGSTTGGNASDPTFTGRWDFYVSYTTDHGATWKTYRATTGPVQVGSVCTAGTTCGADRNLLDFNDMVLDPATGRVSFAYADGCPTALCNPSVRGEKATIGRQTGGPSLLSRFDPQ